MKNEVIHIQSAAIPPAAGNVTTQAMQMLPNKDQSTAFFVLSVDWP